ncbi:MAG: amidophosphoribosyltransferase [Candidatus Nezhaarchaeota archaeon]|nr:amidophosphoribosyltransferase [Candidatus Nezhaarchaeota archaeon]MCX8141428.1 amidophosphoribosyltransferase [Candidatus Nezhaarchaeota archaeon]MDW8049694.1 amidophosphoribosyltransferase [Nitrososphaerota archaeon]
MAGIVGIYAFDKLWRMARFTYYSLLALQHRGQESAGLVTCHDEGLIDYKGRGNVDRIFYEEKLTAMTGWMSIGCVDAEVRPNQSIQPIIVSRPIRLAFCMDGKAVNWNRLAVEEGISAESDVEAIAKILSKYIENFGPSEGALKLLEVLSGGYCFIALTERKEMIVARSPSGLKPMVIGSFGFDYGIVASESCAIDVIGAEYKADILPGEVYLFTPYSIERARAPKSKVTYCSFEYVYLARPDSYINDVSVYDARTKIGEVLAEEYPVDGDVIIGVPETAIPFAIAYSNKTKIPLAMGFVRTGPHVRSAIKPTQFERLVGVQLKLNPIKSAIRGKRLILIDDSVVRGNTTKNTVTLMRNKLGVKEVHVRIGSPKIISHCPFGVEVPPEDELIARHLTDEEVAAVVGADSFHWLSVDGLVKAIGFPRNMLCLGCFTGEYPPCHKG